jgi:hypothetical protein
MKRQFITCENDLRAVTTDYDAILILFSLTPFLESNIRSESALEFDLERVKGIEPSC